LRAGLAGEDFHILERPFTLLYGHCSAMDFLAMEDVTLPPDFSLQSIRIASVEGGEAGILVLRANLLVAVLTQIDEELYATQGQWFLETGFGPLTGQHRNFHSLEEAVTWIGIGGQVPAPHAQAQG
jgi:hypothetical protein